MKKPNLTEAREVALTIAVGALSLGLLPAALIVLVYKGGPALFFVGILLGLWGALVGRHLLEAIRDGAAAYGYAKATKAWGQVR